MKLVQYCIAMLIITITLTIPAQMKAQHNKAIKQKKEADMDQLTANKALVRQLFETALNPRKFELVQQFIHPEYTSQTGQQGLNAFTSQVTDLLKANPDLQWTIHELVAENNKVWARWTTTINPSSDKPITTTGIGTYIIENGKIIRSFALIDRLSFFQQKKLLPENIGILQAKASPEKVIFIDRFVVPASALTEFKQRVKINRELIRTIPGFIEDATFENKDSNGNTIYVTIAQWTSQESLQKAKEAVQAAYKKEGFDIAAMLSRLNITLDRQQLKPAAEL
ncbi:ester cyclase [Pseudoflavitalea rhizosphaerae]|uniref:ester cyclase n=1 Tax=Pseudoflavitalea rhizosphaerae TaxID=1884793 RepID=UPI000F8F742C|nr:ester cyclase [Pseudoflavitalea rhizosphaerae]